MRTLTEFHLASSPEWFTVGKANVAAMPPANRAKHAVSMCMVEAGHVPPRWLTDEDGLLVSLLPDGFHEWDDATQDEWCNACDRAIWLTIERLGGGVVPRPTPGGNLVLTGRSVRDRFGDQTPEVRVLRRGEAPPGNTYQPHWRDCPYADEHRRKR